jgi:hypothetical protein
MTHHFEVREREFAALDILADPQQTDASPALEKGTTAKRLEDAFFSISGTVVDAAGKLYFLDHHNQRICGWSGKRRSHG